MHDSDGDAQCNDPNHCLDASGKLPNHVSSKPIFLDGGPGSTSYQDSAHNSYTGFSSSGASSNPALEGRTAGPSLANDSLVWIRDNTNIRERLGNSPEVSANVYYETQLYGWNITGVSISNTSYEQIMVSSVKVTIYSQYGNDKVSSELLYPYSYPSIHKPDYGIAEPGTTSGIINVSTGVIPSWNYVDVRVRVLSYSGRFGDISLSFAVNPP